MGWWPCLLFGVLTMANMEKVRSPYWNSKSNVRYHTKILRKWSYCSPRLLSPLVTVFCGSSASTYWGMADEGVPQATVIISKPTKVHDVSWRLGRAYASVSCAWEPFTNKIRIHLHELNLKRAALWFVCSMLVLQGAFRCWSAMIIVVLHPSWVYRDTMVPQDLSIHHARTKPDMDRLERDIVGWFPFIGTGWHGSLDLYKLN